MSLLEKDTTKKERMNKFAKVAKFDKDNNKEYKEKAIQDSAVYAKKADKPLSVLYYLVV